MSVYQTKRRRIKARGDAWNTCCIAWCEDVHYAKGYCRRHHTHARRHDGNPLSSLERSIVDAVLRWKEER